jgi:hypothetical protein
MPSIGNGIKQNATDGGFFMPLSSLQNVVYAFTPGSGAGGSFAQGSLSTASWATLTFNGKGNPYLSSINGAGAGMLKDMGKTVVSAGRTFRKVQLVVSQGNAPLGNQGVSTNGVGGQNGGGSTPVQDYLTGFIELGFEGQGSPAPVAQFGR